MFQALQNLLSEGASLQLTVTHNKGGALTVVVSPVGGTATQPLALTASAVELDAEFVSALDAFGTARKSLAEQVEATTAIIEAAKQESAAKAVKAVTKGAKPSAATSTLKDKLPASSSEDDNDEDDGVGADVVPATASTEAPETGFNLFA